MRITLVCAHYLPELGYLEVHLARAFVAAGHQVHVVTTTSVPAYLSKLQQPPLSGNEMDGEVHVHRLRPFFTLGQIALAGNVADTVRSTRPELLVVPGPGKYFPKPVYRMDIPVITLMGDNKDSFSGKGWVQKLKKNILISLFKRPVYRLALRRSHKLIAYTPESFEAASQILRGSDRLKMRTQNHFVSLGFNDSRFYFDAELRNRKRRSMGFSDSDLVIITATRVVPEKRLETYIPALASLPAHCKWLVVGGNDSAYSHHFAKKAIEAIGPQRFRLLPFSERNELNALLNAADIALYSIAAITIFEALGTGLSCILPPDESLSGLLADQRMAMAYTPGTDDDLYKAINNYIHTQMGHLAYSKLREERATLALQKFSWGRIATEVLEIAKI